jgi:hypothetical protein
MTRSPLLLVAVAGALALGACGGSNGSGGSGTNPKSRADTAFDGAVKFSQCMRDHGVKDWPDPQRAGNGLIKMAGPKNLDPNDPTVKSATAACQKYMKAGGGQAADPAQRAKAQDAMVKYAGCMRSHGIDMKDPDPNSGGFLFRKGQGPNPNSPAYKAADEQCHHFLGELQRQVQGAAG